MELERDKVKHVVDQAVATYDLETSLESTDHAEALRLAITAAIRSYEAIVVSEVSEDAITAAEMMDEDGGDIADDGVAALLWFARELQESLPVDDRE